MRILTITSPRAGSGKTTTAVNLAAELAALGHRVALVDLDPRAAATAALGASPVADPWNTRAASIPYGPGNGALMLRAGGRGLAGARGPDIATLIERAGDGVDCVVVDSAPGAGTLSTAAVEPARVLLATLPASSDAHLDLRSTAQLRYLVGSPHALRAAFVRVSAGLDTTALRAAVAEAYPGSLLAGEIPEDPAVAAAERAGRPLRFFAPESAAARAYQRLAAEVARDLLHPE